MTPQHSQPDKRGSSRGDPFGSPDGLWFDGDGRLWIATDFSSGAIGHGDYQRIGNNQLLVADVVSGDIRRFLTGPSGCEVTGLTGSPDGRHLFINIQHPGEGGGRLDSVKPLASADWPANQFPGLARGRPRSATIVVRRSDGGVVGS